MSERLTVLVADDSRVIRKAFSRVMADHYELIEAEDGQAAWDQLQANDEICAVFSDWEMPHMDGIELAQNIRNSKNPRIRALPLIMVTSKTEDEATKQAAFDAGATDFVAKPFDTTELLARAKVHVKRIDVSGQQDSGQAVMDPDNRIGNAQYFQQQGAQMLAFANRHNLPMSVALIGIDNLQAQAKLHGADEKQIDEFVLTVGTHMSEKMRKEDSIARLGKAIFGVLLSSADIKTAYFFAERLNKSLAKESFLLNGEEMKVTVSVGIESSEPSRKRQIAGLMKTARERLVLAARTGNEIRPQLKVRKQQRKLDSLDKALSLVVNKRADDVDLGYLMKRLFPLLVHFDKKLNTELAKSVLPVIKGEKK